MKKLLLIILILFSIGCTTKDVNDDIYTSFIEPKSVVLDSCEYMFVYNNYTRIMYFAHKGNCKYCIERSKKYGKYNKSKTYSIE